MKNLTPEPWKLRAVCLAVSVLCLLPVFYLMVRTVQAGSEAWSFLFSRRTLRILLNSLWLAAAVTATSVTLGSILAWLTCRTQLPGRKGWLLLLVLPMVLPSYISAFSLIAAFGPHGALQQILAPLGVQEIPAIYGFKGAWLALSLFTYPYVLLTVRAGLVGQDASREEVAATLGQRPFGIFWSVIFPQLRTAICGGGILVALYTLSDFGAVSLLGYPSFTQAIYLQYVASFDRHLAAALSLMLLVLTFTLLILERKTAAREHAMHSGGSTARRVRRLPLGTWTWPSLLLCGFVVSIALGIPLLVIGFWMIRGWQIREWPFDGFDAVWNSASISAAGAVLCVLAAIPVAYYRIRFPGPRSEFAERVSYIGHALPGIVVALALVFFTIRYAHPLYQTYITLLAAYVILFIPLAGISLRANLLHISPRIEEAARGLGSRNRDVFRRITLPLMRPGILAALVLVFLSCMKELPATLLLSPIGFETLAIQLWSATEEAFFIKGSGPALILILISSASVWLILRYDELRMDPEGGRA
jgi:iron(III) transport system permease protein